MNSLPKIFLFSLAAACRLFASETSYQINSDGAFFEVFACGDKNTGDAYLCTFQLTDLKNEEMHKESGEAITFKDVYLKRLGCDGSSSTHSKYDDQFGLHVAFHKLQRNPSKKIAFSSESFNIPRIFENEITADIKKTLLEFRGTESVTPVESYAKIRAMRGKSGKIYVFIVQAVPRKLKFLPDRNVNTQGLLRMKKGAHPDLEIEECGTTGGLNEYMVLTTKYNTRKTDVPSIELKPEDFEFAPIDPNSEEKAFAPKNVFENLPLKVE